MYVSCVLGETFIKKKKKKKKKHIIMSPSSKKLEGHIASGSFVRPSIRLCVRPSVKLFEA